VACGRSTTEVVREGHGLPVARARWRRCFALSLALRLFARIALLDLAVFFTSGLRSGLGSGLM